MIVIPRFACLRAARSNLPSRARISDSTALPGAASPLSRQDLRRVEAGAAATRELNPYFLGPMLEGRHDGAYLKSRQGRMLCAKVAEQRKMMRTLLFVVGLAVGLPAHARPAAQVKNGADHSTLVEVARRRLE